MVNIYTLKLLRVKLFKIIGTICWYKNDQCFTLKLMFYMVLFLVSHLRGFESLSLRQITTEALYLRGFVVFDSWLRIYSVTELCHKKAEKHAKPLTNLPI